MKRLVLALLLLPAIGLAAVSGVWQLSLVKVGGSTVRTITGSTQDETWDACLTQLSRQPAGTTKYACQTLKYVATVTADQPPPPPAVDCVVSDWSTWTGGNWSACVNGTQTRQEGRSRSVVTTPSNGGAACPPLTETRTATQACTVTPPDPPVTGDFATLCKQPGVTRCYTFDSSSEISSRVTAGNGTPPALDTSTKASGAGSMRMTYVAGGTQATGLWKGDIGGPMKPGTHFYFAFKQRFDSRVLGAGGSSNGWKQFILYTAPNDPSRNQTQIVLEKHIQGFPIAYSKCGALPFRDELSSGDIRFQFGDFASCTYRNTSGCWRYVADKWITFYFDVDFKAYGTPSRVKSWLQVDGGKWQPWMDFAPSFGREGSGQFETIQLTMYTTGGANGSGTSWYDDLIVSRQPIYAP